jgi:hypothetical protein
MATPSTFFLYGLETQTDAEAGKTQIQEMKSEQ